MALSIIYCLIFLAGAILTLTAPIFWLRIPSETPICQARLWLTSVGFSIILGTMFSRVNQLREIYKVQKTKEMSHLKHITFKTSIKKLAMTICSIVLINFSILLLWTLSDPYQAYFQETNTLTGTGLWTCTSDYLMLWALLELIWMCLLLLWGVRVLYQTWTFYHRVAVSETKFILAALYNVIISAAILTPFFAWSNSTDDAIALASVIAIDFCTSGIAFATFGPKVWEKVKPKFKAWREHSSQNHYDGSLQKGLDASNNNAGKTGNEDGRNRSNSPSSPSPEISAKELRGKSIVVLSPHPEFRHDHDSQTDHDNKEATPPMESSEAGVDDSHHINLSVDDSHHLQPTPDCSSTRTMTSSVPNQSEIDVTRSSDIENEHETITVY